ncbi:hypothetical protein JQN72_17145 [Phycicoccus sp. CSK15P-2]|uniref:hypothetical protein n=1 Tax=Phycicoccus sp. CSK15P-2 TaxID=2807627 RepID=UPI00194FC7B1|nr:hypothetical protein [Phycicoccus sp. CSK15P-2]MBM6405971.1 hypothetical protein [Phycicoccus sp. CSK15P-2]
MSRLHPWVLPVVGLGALAVVRSGVVDERDPYWQVRAGLENLDGAPLARPDAWSWDPVDALFVQTSPAWNTALGLAWRGGGFTGFFLVTLASMVAYVAVTLLLAARLGARPLPTLGGVLVTLLIAMPMLSPRATLVAQTLFLTAVLAADRARPLAARTPPLLVATVTSLAGVVVAGAGMWLHLSWLLFAPALWAAVAALVVASPDVRGRHALASLGGSGVGLALGVLAGPYGTDAWRISQQVRAACEGVVVEWLPAFTHGLWPRWGPTVLCAVIGSALASHWVLRRWSARADDQRVGLVAALLVLAVPTALGGVLAIRFVGLSLLALPPIAALGATWLAGRVTRRAGEDTPTGLFRHSAVRRWGNGRPWQVVTTLVLVVLSPLVVLSALRGGRPQPEASAVDALPSGCRLLAEPAVASATLLLRPDVPIWTDGRADYWGRERNVAAIRTFRGSDASVGPVQEATCVALETDTPLAEAVAADPSWTTVWKQQGLRVWVRDG